MKRRKGKQKARQGCFLPSNHNSHYLKIYNSQKWSDDATANILFEKAGRNTASFSISEMQMDVPSMVQ